MTYDVIVLGAGMAGLTAARSLAEAGWTVLLLEARGQVGGRMRTHLLPGTGQPVELGAEFIHGRPPELLALLEEAGLAIYEAEGEQLCLEDGKVAPCPQDDSRWALLDRMDAVARAAGDMSFDAFLEREQATIDTATARLARGYVEGFNAADASEIGIVGLARQQAAEDAIEGHRSARVKRGYGALAEYSRERAAAAGVEIFLSAPVCAVQWSAGGATVHVEDGRTWSARKLVCALPLGVLQSSRVLFDPLPAQAVQAWMSLRPGRVQRFVLEFEEQWWAALQPRMHFLFVPAAHPPTWWTTAPRSSTLLTGWVGGPRSTRTPDFVELARQGISSLEAIFAQPIAPLLKQTHCIDWNRDPYTCGAYSYAPAGAADAAQVLATPIADTLFFAGEHTDVTGHPGTVHGALRSGQRAAQQAQEALAG